MNIYEYKYGIYKYMGQLVVMELGESAAFETIFAYS